MNMEIITPELLAKKLHLLDDTGALNERAIANLLRKALSRWGLCLERNLMRYAREQLKAAGVDAGHVLRRVLERLKAFGECDEVFVGHERYLAPAEPRWIRTGDGVGVFLGPSGPPKGIVLDETEQSNDIAQRIMLNSDDDVAQLQASGVREISIREWLTPSYFLEHAARRIQRPARSDRIHLEDFWHLLTDAIVDQGFPLSNDADIRVISKGPGGFFGRRDAHEVEGRWTDQIPEGVWCGVRRGYGEAHWHPVIVTFDGERRLSLDLFDFDEWCWALIARGRALNSDEVVIRELESLKLTFPAPTQIKTALDLFGYRVSTWTWHWPHGAPDFWALIR